MRLEKWKERFADFDSERGWRTLDAVNAIAKEKETTAAAVALAWLLAKPAVTSVIFGARSLEQLDDNLKAADVKLSRRGRAEARRRERVRARLSVQVHREHPEALVTTDRARRPRHALAGEDGP